MDIYYVDLMKARVIYYVYMMKARVDILCVHDEGQNGYITWI